MNNLETKLLSTASRSSILASMIGRDAVGGPKATLDSLAPSIEPRPIFASRAEAIAYLQAEKFPKHHPQRQTAATGSRGEPNRRIIAVVQHPDGKIECLHATKGWRKGIH